MRIVVDTNVFIGAVMSEEGANRTVLRRCLMGVDKPLFASALFTEYRAVLGREELFRSAPISDSRRAILFEALCACAEWVSPYYLWRPNLPDEDDNHVVELAVAGRASWIVSWNVRDLGLGELNFPGLRTANPIEYLAAVAAKESE